MNNMAQGDNIKCLRTREGLTQQQFADMLGVTKETVCRWERGHTAVKVSTLDKLTELFDVTFDELAASNSGLASAGLSSRPENSQNVAQNEECGIYKIVRCNGGFSLKKSGHTFVPGPVLERHPGGFLVQMNNSSMSRCYPQSCVLLVDPVAKPWNGCTVVAMVDASAIVIRRYEIRGNTIALSTYSYLTEEPNITLDRHRLRVLGVVVWFQATHDLTY